MRNRPARPPVAYPAPRLDLQQVASLQRLRARHSASANALRLISVLPSAAPAQVRLRKRLRPAPALIAALETIRARFPSADFRWQLVCPRAGGGSSPAVKTLEAIARANIYVAPGAPLTRAGLACIHYAMAIGMPVLAPAPVQEQAQAQAPGQRKRRSDPPPFDHGVEGLLADYGDPADLADQLARILFDIDLRMRMTHAGKRRMGTVDLPAAAKLGNVGELAELADLGSPARGVSRVRPALRTRHRARKRRS